MPSSVYPSDCPSFCDATDAEPPSAPCLAAAASATQPATAQTPARALRGHAEAALRRPSRGAVSGEGVISTADIETRLLAPVVYGVVPSGSETRDGIGGSDVDEGARERQKRLGTK